MIPMNNEYIMQLIQDLELNKREYHKSKNKLNEYTKTIGETVIQSDLSQLPLNMKSIYDDIKIEIEIHETSFNEAKSELISLLSNVTL
jgi:hypothetical protein